MTSETELQGLSMQAAGCLPELFQGPDWELCTEAPIHDGRDGRVARSYRKPIWLHESTEACAEIMVRVLWPKNVYLHGSDGCAVYQGIPSRAYGSNFILFDGDPMLAFRVAVLKALIALKG